MPQYASFASGGALLFGPTVVSSSSDVPRTLSTSISARARYPDVVSQQAPNIAATGTTHAQQPYALKGYLGNDWHIHQALSLELEREASGWYIISDSEFFVYGDGPTIVAAWEDYLSSLREFCCLVREAAPRRPENRAQYQHLLTYIRPVAEER